MVHTLYLNSLELSPAYDIYITEEPSFDPSTKYETNVIWRGTSAKVLDISSGEVKISLKGLCNTEAGLRSILHYDSHNYNWNTDSEEVYLIRDLSRRWKVSLIEIRYTLAREVYYFTMNLVLENLGAQGYVQTAKSGTSSSSPISVTGVENAGDRDVLFESIKITGNYASGANLVSPNLSQTLVGYDLDIADVLLDTAYIEFYDDYTAKHTYIDAFNTTDKFTRNKNDSTNATFDTNHVDIAASGELEYRFRLKHPLLQDPVLTLTCAITGSPTLEVSPDGTNFWEVEKTLVSGTLVEYNLTKLSGYSDFYFRIVTSTGETVALSYMKLVSWHDYSGQRPVPYIRSGSVSESYSITFSSGSLDYDIRYRDSWSA